MQRKNIYFLIFITTILYSGCRVQYVSDYDENIKNEIIRINKEVDRIYSIMLETPLEKRSYENFKNLYISTEIDLRTLLTMNKIRPLNEESIKQTEIAIELWIDDKEKHKENDTVSDFIIKQHRNQFQRIFIAMAIGEQVKEE